MGEDRDPRTVTRLLEEMADGEEGASERLTALVYDELLQIAEQRMAQERRGHTLQASDLVHEAYIRLLGSLETGPWVNRAHFFGAAAEAMRRVLIEHARRRERVRHGGGRKRVSLDGADLTVEEDPSTILAVEEAIRRLQEWDPRLGEIVRLRFFAGLEIQETAEVLGMSPRTIKRGWTFARAWLYSALEEDGT